MGEWALNDSLISEVWQFGNTRLDRTYKLLLEEYWLPSSKSGKSLSEIEYVKKFFESALRKFFWSSGKSAITIF